MNELTIPYSADTRRGPLSWGQTAILAPLLAYNSESSYFNNEVSMKLDTALSWSDFKASAGKLIERHEALRTLLWCKDIRSPQTVSSQGAIEVTEVESGAEFNPAVEHARARPFNLHESEPIRFVVKHSPSGVSRVAVVFSHFVADAVGVQLLAAEMRRYLANQPIPNESPSGPIDIAQLESANYYRDRSDRAIRRWMRTLESTDRLAGTPPAYEKDRWLRLRLESSELAAANSEVRRKYKVGHSAPVLDAYISSLSECTGHQKLAVKVIVGNNLHPSGRLAATLAPMAQDGIVGWQRASSPIESMRSTNMEVIRAAGMSRYDPIELEEAIERAGLRSSTLDDVRIYFNDIRNSARVAPREIDEDRMQVWRAGSHAYQDCQMFLTLYRTTFGEGLDLLVDTKLMCESTASALLVSVVRRLSKLAEIA